MRLTTSAKLTGNHNGYGGTYQMVRFDPVAAHSATGTVILVADPGQGGAAFVGPGGGFDINVNGVVAGYGSISVGTANARHAMLWYPGGAIKDVNVLAGLTDAYLFGINDNGIAVGVDATVTKPFVFDANNNTFTYLDNLLSDPAWDLQQAYAINNAGQIVGMGTFNSTATAFLLTPVQSGSTRRGSANYTLSPETRDGGGRRTTSGSYTNDGSIGAVAGISAVASPAEIAKAGYVAQLYDVTGLVVSAACPSVNETGMLQLNPFQLFDDSSNLSIPATLVNWAVVTGPIVGISVAGVATAGVVYQNTPVTVQGALAPYTASVNFTVLDTIADNFGTYAGDGVGDDWQVQYFGLNNPNAGPNVDFDHTGQTNLFKYIAGLNPLDPNSRFTLKIEMVPGQPGRKALIFSPRFTDRTYTIKAKSSLLTPGAWSAIAASAPSDNGPSARSPISTRVARGSFTASRSPSRDSV